MVRLLERLSVLLMSLCDAPLAPYILDQRRGQHLYRAAVIRL